MNALAAVKKGDFAPLMAVDAWSWAFYNKIQLVSGLFGIDGVEYQHGYMQSDARRKCVRKATQMTFTESEVIDSLHGCINRMYPRGVLYLFPTKDDVTDFSASRFKPLITENPTTIGRYVNDTNRENLKRVGSGFLFFRSASLSRDIQKSHKTSTKLKSIPTDKTVFDEMDEMDQAARGLAIKRMERSEVKKESYLANPTLNDFGVDRVYESESDRRIWDIKCSKCGKHSCLELHFPACLERLKDGRVIRLCPKCRDRELYPKDGIWVPRNPSRSDWMEGFWISHLNNIFTDPREILDTYEKLEWMKPYEVTQFWNLVMGMGHVSAENRLTIQQVFDLCSNEGITNKDPGPCYMGVDQGNDLHVVIGKRSFQKAGRLVHLGIYRNWEDLDPLMKYFQVSRCVVDALPETRNARAFAERHRGKVYLNYYNQHQKGSYAWNEKELIVSCNRSESLDASHKEIMDQAVILPKQCEIVQKFAQHMHNVAKKLEEDEETGSKRYVYVKLGPDHFRHAFNYEAIARGFGAGSMFSEADLS